MWGGATRVVYAGANIDIQGKPAEIVMTTWVDLNVLKVASRSLSVSSFSGFAGMTRVAP